MTYKAIAPVTPDMIQTAWFTADTAGWALKGRFGYHDNRLPDDALLEAVGHFKEPGVYVVVSWPFGIGFDDVFEEKSAEGYFGLRDGAPVAMRREIHVPDLNDALDFDFRIHRCWHPSGFPGPVKSAVLGHCAPDEMLARVREHAANVLNIYFDTREAVFEYANFDGSAEHALSFERVDTCTFDDEHIEAIEAAAEGLGIDAVDNRADDEADGA